jgi:hypothetical protein
MLRSLLLRLGLRRRDPACVGCLTNAEIEALAED